MPISTYPSNAATKSDIYELQWQLQSMNLGSYPGKVDWVLSSNGQPTAGYQKLGGVAAPSAMFRFARSVLFPYTRGNSGFTIDTLSGANAYRATLGDYVLIKGPQTQHVTRLLNVATMTTADMPNWPFSNYAPGALGTVNNKFVTVGGDYQQSGGSCFTVIYTLDPTAPSPAWTPRASLPTALTELGVCDLGDGKLLVLGGKNQNVNNSTTATNIVSTLHLFNDVANTCAALPQALPARMSNVRTAMRADKKIYVWPVYTSDGTTLNNTGRRMFLLDTLNSYSSIELDNVPVAAGNHAGIRFVDEFNRLVIVPTVAPTSGARAFRCDPTQPSGSQWTQIDWDTPSFAYAAEPLCAEAKVTTEGLQFNIVNSSTPQLTWCVTRPDYTQLILQSKTN